MRECLSKEFWAGLIGAFFTMTRCPNVVIGRLIFRSLSSNTVWPWWIKDNGTFSMKEVNSSSTLFNQLHRLVRILLNCFCFLARSNDLSVPWNGIRNVTISIMSMSFIDRVPFLKVVIVSTIGRIFIGVEPFFGDVFFTRRAQYGAANSRYYFGNSNSQATRQICRIALSVPSNRRGRTNDWCFIRQDFCNFLAMTASIG